MRFRLLGELEVESGGRVVRVRGRRLRLLLACLLVKRNQPLSRDRLLDALWGARPPPSGSHGLEVLVSQLRHLLGPEDGSRIETTPGGYRLRVAAEELDLDRFERLSAAGRRALDDGDDEAAVRYLREALDEWRGQAFGDLVYEPCLSVEAARIEEMRLEALEAMFEAELRCGRPETVVSELEAFVAENPLREHARAQLMLALYRCGRQAEALAVYREGRRRLVDELGVEPGHELQELEQAILRQAPQLESSAPAPTIVQESPRGEESALRQGASLEPPQERRKIVTVVFCDVTGSTTLGPPVDPEVLQALVGRSCESVREIVERHGGSMEKFVGGAAMAVFGVPIAHDDDALRACSAALEMRTALRELGIEARIGVMTGEVLAGTEGRLATGDAVTVAARLQEAAQPGDVLIGEAARALVRGVAEVEPVPPSELKGTPEPATAFRLLRLTDAPLREQEPPFVGRGGELALLQGAWGHAHAERRCELATIVGEAGLGKSRLVAEFERNLDVRVVRGRCLPYGKGITYWPAVEVVKQLDARPSDPTAAAAIRSLLGETEEATTSEEIAWSFRRLLEEQAPLVVVFDDIHWGEEAFLDLVEHVALLSSTAPILLVCMARPELLAKRNDWPVALQLEPLTDEHIAELIGTRLPAELRERVARAAGGNPLFAVEMLAMAEERLDVEVPPTLRALLAARLDQLGEPERQVLEHAAVEGEIFHRGSVQALTPEEPQLTHRLAALSRRGLIRPHEAQIAGEDAFRFCHLLIRDATYEALPKGTRAGLHRRFAEWLEEHGGAVAEVDEILGYHLEQAVRYLDELGRPDPALSERAGDRLAAAGREALSRDDHVAAASLLDRAVALTPPTRLDVALETDLAIAVGLADLRRAVAIADAAARRAGETGDAAGEAHARIVSARMRGWTGELSEDALEREARAALPLLEHAGDEVGLAEAWEALWLVGNCRNRWSEALAAIEQAIEHDRLAGRKRADPFDSLAIALYWGPCPADEALRQIDVRIPEPRSPLVLSARAGLIAMLDRFDEAWREASEQCARLRLGGYSGEMTLGGIAMIAGEDETAARHLQTACEEFDALGNCGLVLTCTLLLARSLFFLGRYDEVERLCEQAERLALPDVGVADAGNEESLTRLRALVRVHRYECAEAEQLAREAVRLAEQMEAPLDQGNAHFDLAQVLEAAGKPDEAAAAYRDGLAHYERKQIIPLARRTRERLDALHAGDARLVSAPLPGARTA